MIEEEGESSTEYFSDDDEPQKVRSVHIENVLDSTGSRESSGSKEDSIQGTSPSLDRLKDTFEELKFVPEVGIKPKNNQKKTNNSCNVSKSLSLSNNEENKPKKRRSMHKKSRSEGSSLFGKKSSNGPNGSNASAKLQKKQQQARRRKSVVSRVALWESYGTQAQLPNGDEETAPEKSPPGASEGKRTSKIFEDEKRVQSVILDQLHQISELEIENALLKKKVTDQQRIIDRLKSELSRATSNKSGVILITPKKKRKKKNVRKKGRGTTFSWSFRSFKKKAKKDQQNRKERKQRSLGGYSDFWNIKDISFVLDNLKKDFRDHFEKGNKISKNSRQINKIQEVEYTKIVDLGRPDDPHGKIHVLPNPEQKLMYVHSLIPGCRRVFDAKLINEKTTFRDVAIKKFALHNKQDALRVLEELNHNVTLSSRYITGVIGYHVHWSKLPEVGIVMEKMDYDVSQFTLNYDNIQKQHKRPTNELPEKLSDAHKFLIMYKMVKCLSFIHSMGVVHRDVKGKNFLIRIKIHHSKMLRPENYMIKLADFGLSKKLGKRGIYISSTSGGGKGKGTNYWLAPELIRVSESSEKFRKKRIVYSFQSDIYALGITFWEVLAEMIPYSNYEYDYESFSPISERNLLLDIADKGRRPKVDGIIKDIRFLELLERCWSGDLKERYKKMEEIEDWFEANKKYFLRDLV